MLRLIFPENCKHCGAFKALLKLHTSPLNAKLQLT